jgi:very-short-patch-repair endonuclease
MQREMGRKKEVKQKSSLNAIEQKMMSLLHSMNFSYKSQATIDNYNVDFLIDEKYIIECYGDYWHCNPARYAADYYNRGKKKTAAEIWKRDEKRKRELERLGYKVLYFWEHEINNNIKDIKAALKRYIT